MSTRTLGDDIDITIVDVTRPSRPLMHGRRPLPDETLGQHIERVVMRLPERQRPVMWAGAPPDIRVFEPSFLSTPILPSARRIV